MPEFSDPARGTRGRLPERDGRVRCSGFGYPLADLVVDILIRAAVFADVEQGTAVCFGIANLITPARDTMADSGPNLADHHIERI